MKQKNKQLRQPMKAKDLEKKDGINENYSGKKIKRCNSRYNIYLPSHGTTVFDFIVIILIFQVKWKHIQKIKLKKKKKINGMDMWPFKYLISNLKIYPKKKKELTPQ